MYRRILIGGATAAVIVGSGTAALALSEAGSTTNGAPSVLTPSSSSAAPSGHGGSTAGSGSSAHGKKDHGKGHRAHRGAKLLRRTQHGSFVIRTRKHGYVTVDLIRGNVTSVSSSSITVRSMDDKSETFHVTKDTKVMLHKKGAKPSTTTIGSIAENNRVLVVGTGSSSMTAKRIVTGLPTPRH